MPIDQLEKNNDHKRVAFDPDLLNGTENKIKIYKKKSKKLKTEKPENKNMKDSQNNEKYNAQ